MKRLFFTLTVFVFIINGSISLAQQDGFGRDTIVLSRYDAEALFLQQNISLISEQLNIDKAEAILVQAKLWPNPTFAIDELNFWTTENGTNNISFFGEELPPILGGFGRSRQVSLQVEQLVRTAGKRKKMIALEEVNASIAKAYFEDLLRNLKIEFRKSITQLQYLQFYSQTFIRQLESIQNLVMAFKNQLDNGNISKGEYVRLKALELELLSKINELLKETTSIQKELKILMRLPSDSFLKITEESFMPDTEKLQGINLIDIQQTALKSRPDLNIAQLEESYYTGKYAYERAQRIPDLNFSVGYDRGGSFLLDFVGFGLSFDIPLFDRNQGNIKYAQIGMDQSKLLVDQKIDEVQLEVEAAYSNLIANKNLYESIEENYESDLEELLEAYTKNFKSRNISLLEYLDFLDAYLENKKIILDTRKELHNSFEEIQYIIGKEIN